MRLNPFDTGDGSLAHTNTGNDIITDSHTHSISLSTNESTRADERLGALEEEVRSLWAASRKINFDIYNLESKAQDAENRLEKVASQVEKIVELNDKDGQVKLTCLGPNLLDNQQLQYTVPPNVWFGSGLSQQRTQHFPRWYDA